jgi:hypothetical protein
MAWGRDDTTNVYTGERVKPILIDLDKGGRNEDSLSFGLKDTDVVRQVCSDSKIQYVKTLPVINKSTVTSLLTIENVKNYSLMRQIDESEILTESILHYLPFPLLQEIKEYVSKSI